MPKAKPNFLSKKFAKNFTKNSWSYPLAISQSKARVGNTRRKAPIR